MMTASTRIFTPADTTLPSTFSARKAVRPKRPKGTSTKPASVVSLNSIRVTKSWIAITKKLRMTINQAMKSIAIWMKFSKKLVKPIKPLMESRIGLPRVDTDLGVMARLQKLRLGERAAAGFQAQSGQGIEDDLGEVVKVPDDVGEDTYI